MSEYQKMVRNEAKTFYKSVQPTYADDDGEFGGKSEQPNLSKWLDRTRKLFEHLDSVSKSWGRADAEMINTESRNSVTYGNPKESAYFAFYKDILRELKKLRKAGV